MPRIISVQNAGEAWHSQQYNTWNWPYRYQFDNGIVGIANHQSETPPFAVGEEVEVIVKGTDQRGNTKLSVKKPQGQQGGGGYQQSAPQQSGGQQRSSGYTSGKSSPNGQRIGMTINNAVLLTIHGFAPVAEGKKLSQHLLELSYALGIVSDKLESGWTPKGSSTPSQQPQQGNVSQYEESVNQNTGPHQHQQSAPPQNQGGGARNYPAADEQGTVDTSEFDNSDVPF